MMPKQADYKRDIKLIDSTLFNLIKGRLFALIAVTVMVLALLVLSFLNNLIQQQLNHHAQSHVPMPAARNLLSHLSPMSLEVLAWVWADRREPLKIEQIKQLSRELRQGRFKYIEDARAQEQLLNQHLYGTAATSEPLIEEPTVRVAPVTADATVPTAPAPAPQNDSSKLSENATHPAEKDIIIVNDAPKA